tara:strand:- start:1369 stop:1956 length:588 start_codon:yes stop_codon:yes gene_type:complete
MKIIATATFAALAALVGAAPAAAQDDAGDRVNMVIVYGDDPCPPSVDGEIVVCAVIDESERFRIPENLRYSDDPANTSWAQRVQAFKFVGDFGAMSCSPTGAMGFTGCSQKMIDAAYEARKGGSAARFSQLIAEARAERLSTIDEDAAAEQARVEQIEREYMERLEKESQSEVADEPLPVPPAATSPADSDDDDD